MSALLAALLLGSVQGALAQAQVDCPRDSALECGHLSGDNIVGGDCVENPPRSIAETTYVASQNSGFQDGTAAHPYQALAPALAVAAPGSTIVIRTGSYNLPGGLINKPATIRADNGLVTITSRPLLGGVVHLPFDLVSQSSDPNGFPKNPTWGYLVDRGLLPDAMAQCSISNNAADWYTPPKACTNDHVTIDKRWECPHGHVNWSSATYEGIVFWQDHSKSDNDYNITISTPDRALYTARNGSYLLMEFDSDETIAHFPEAQQWWQSFQRDVNVGIKNPGGINQKFAVVIGLVGLDVRHDAHAELHPVYALAINYDDQTGWAFFVRNWGNEGGCGDQDHYLPLQTIRILLPRPFATEGQVISQNIWGTPSTGGVWWFAPGEGIVTEFRLPPPSSHALIVGDVRVGWTEREPMRAMFSRIQAPSIPGEPEDDMEARLNKIIENMSEDERGQYRALSRRLAEQEEQMMSFAPLTLLPAGPSEHQDRSAPTSPQVGPSDYQNRRLRALCSVLQSNVSEFSDLCKHVTGVAQPTK